MPDYDVTLTDGRTIRVTLQERPGSDAELQQQLNLAADQFVRDNPPPGFIERTITGALEPFKKFLEPIGSAPPFQADPSIPVEQLDPELARVAKPEEILGIAERMGTAVFPKFTAAMGAARGALQPHLQQLPETAPLSLQELDPTGDPEEGAIRSAVEESLAVTAGLLAERGKISGLGRFLRPRPTQPKIPSILDESHTFAPVGEQLPLGLRMPAEQLPLQFPPRLTVDLKPPLLLRHPFTGRMMRVPKQLKLPEGKLKVEQLRLFSKEAERLGARAAAAGFDDAALVGEKAAAYKASGRTVASADAPVEVRIAAQDSPFPPELAKPTFYDRGIAQLKIAAANNKTTGEYMRRTGHARILVREDPAALAITDAGNATAQLTPRIEYEILQEMANVLKTPEGVAMTPEQVTKMVRVWQRMRRSNPAGVQVDGPSPELLASIKREAPEATQAIQHLVRFAQNMRRKLISGGRLSPTNPRHNDIDYIFFARDKKQVGLEELVLIEQGPEYSSVWLQQSMPKRPRLAFERALKSRRPPEVLSGEETLTMMARQYARARAIDEVFWPEVQASFSKIQPEFREYMRSVINGHMGVPGFRAPVSDFQRFGKVVASGITLGFNPGSMIYNLTQNFNTFVRSSTKSFAAGVASAARGSGGLSRAQVWERARKLGVIGEFSKADIESAMRFDGIVRNAIAGVVDKSLKGFRWTENVNRVVAFETGLAEAAKLGLTGQAAERFAMSLVFDTQFVLQTELGIFGQFKSYVTGQSIFVARQYGELAAAGELFMRGRVSEAMARLKEPMKFLGGGSILFGGDVTGLNLLVEPLTDNQISVKGVVPALGISLINQFGLGSLPVNMAEFVQDPKEGMRDVMFFIPGPLLAKTSDFTSAMLWALDQAGAPIPFHKVSPSDMVDGTFGDKFRPEDIDEVRRRAVSSVNIELNRLIELARQVRSSGGVFEPTEIRESINLMQAFGAEIPTGDLRAIEQAESKLFRAAGLLPEETQVTRKIRGKQFQEDVAVSQFRRTLGTFVVAGGDMEVVRAEFDELVQTYGVEVMPRLVLGLDKTIVSGMLRNVLTPQQRRLFLRGVATAPGTIKKEREERQKRSLLFDVIPGLLGGQR